MKSTGWILYPRYVANYRDNAFSWLRSEAERCCLELEVLLMEDLEVVYGDREILFRSGTAVKDYPGFVIIRGYEWVLSRHFELRGIPVINSTLSMAQCRDKMLTHGILTAKGIPSPRTLYISGSDYDYQTTAWTLGSSRFIVKQRDGSKGENVFLVSDESELRHALESCGYNAICQKFIEESSGRDIRVWTIGGEAVAAVERYSDSSFLSNFSQGGKVRPVRLTARFAELAEAASGALGVEFAGVDLLLTNGGPTVNEVNGNAGFRTLSQVGENDIPRRLFEYIMEKYR